VRTHTNRLKFQPQFLKLKHSGTFSSLKVLNAPRQVFSIGSNSAQLIVDSVSIDNSAGDELSGGKKLGHNTDCFDVSANNVIIKNSRCVNQDDCLAIGATTGVQFLNNYCSGTSVAKDIDNLRSSRLFQVVMASVSVQSPRERQCTSAQSVGFPQH
jgi:hypothetical protein